MVERQPDATDRRVVRVRMTEEGMKLSSELQRAGREFLRLVFERIGTSDAADLAHALASFSTVAQELLADGTYNRLLKGETATPS
jgi:DNA-binding MarR family transcriptional regulator